MSIINNIKELKDIINKLPDDMKVTGYDGSDRECFISCWIQENDKDFLTWLSQDNNTATYTDRIAVPFFVLSTDN